jgi:hypothetical protein
VRLPRRGAHFWLPLSSQRRVKNLPGRPLRPSWFPTSLRSALLSSPALTSIGDPTLPHLPRAQALRVPNSKPMFLVDCPHSPNRWRPAWIPCPPAAQLHCRLLLRKLLGTGSRPASNRSSTFTHPSPSQERLVAGDALHRLCAGLRRHQ